MRLSHLMLRTLREAPADADAVSHQLLVRAGYVRRVASGIYTFLPLGWRVLRNVERVVREEMDAAGAQEMLMPILQPQELWEQTGRLTTMADVLFRLEGKGGGFVLAPTHEELVTATVAAEVDSYRDLPLNVYQIQFKYRDEPRPRFGLLRGREFIMKDAYSFDATQEDMRASYRVMYDAYCRVFDRLGLSYTPVEADAGSIGGDVNHEFMVASPIGEDVFARCTAGDYAANVEAAETGPRALSSAGDEHLEEHHTPDRPGIDQVVEFFADRGLTAAGMLKCIAFVDEGRNGASGAAGADDGAEERSAVVILVPGDRDVRVPAGLRPFEDEDFALHPELVKGYIGPMGLREAGVRVLADHAVRSGGPWVTGANKADHHVSGATLGRDFTVAEWGTFATLVDGDPCPRCGSGLELVQSVEAGHTFQLGLTYSSKIPGATFADEGGHEQPFWMGCYGIGVSRAPAVIAEEHHDEAGLVWPVEVAPFQVHLLSLGVSRSPEVQEAADRLYAELTAAGVSVMYDDRDASPGVKFADADLLGMPTQVLVGTRSLARGVVERKDRRSGDRDEVAMDQIVASLAPARGAPRHFGSPGA